MPPPLRLCFIGPHTHIHMARWVRFFVEQGHQVTLISTEAKEPTEFLGCVVHPFPMARSRSYFLNLTVGILALPLHVLRLRRLIQALKPDVVHVHYINEAAFYTLLSGFRPLLLTAWGSDVLISPQRSWVRRWVVRQIVSRADAVTCDADHMKERLMELGARPEKVPVIFFGTDVEKFHPKFRGLADRQRWDSLSCPVVISIRSLEPVYDIDSVIRAAVFVTQKIPSAVFWVGGKGSQRERLEKLAAELGVANHVKFLGAFQSDDLPALLASADVYVSTALSDGGLAASTAEAMACGVPVIVTDVCNNRHWVEDGLNGFVVPPQEPKLLAERILDLLGSPETRARMGMSGRSIIVERNNFRREMTRVDFLYRGLARSSPLKETP